MPVMEQLRAWLVAPVLAELAASEARMTSREESAYSNLNQTIESVKAGWTSLTAERDQYRAALEAADANQAQAVQDALAADSDHDAAAIEAADASLAELVVQSAPEPAPEPTPDPAPVDGGDSSVTDEPAGDPNA